MTILSAIKKNISNKEYIYNLIDIFCRIYLSFYTRIRPLFTMKEKGKLPLAYQIKNYYFSKRIQKLIPNSIEKYKTVKNLDLKQGKKIIWICWYQGQEKMPEVVKTCYQSVIKNSKDYQVKLIDEQWIISSNLISKNMIDKWKNKEIGDALFSDIVRHTVLSIEGGIWLDATCYLNKPLSDELLNYAHYSAKNLKKFPMWFQYIYTEEWTSYFLESKKNSYTESFLRDALLEYWNNHKYMIDYLLVNYIAKYGRENIETIRSEYEAIPPNNYFIEEYGTKMNQIYDEKLFEFQSETTDVYKLSYKYPVESMIEGKKTFYGYIKEKNAIDKHNYGN